MGCAKSRVPTLPTRVDDILRLKYIMVGDSGVGKSSILVHFTEKRFIVEAVPTLGVEFGTQTLNINDKQVKLQVWDTAGQERFRSIIRGYYRGAKCAILVFDRTQRSSFTSLITWLTELNTMCPEIKIVLVGNKSDLEDAIVVSSEEAEKFAQAHGLTYLETSAKTGAKIEDLFMNTARELII